MEIEATLELKIIAQNTGNVTYQQKTDKSRILCFMRLNFIENTLSGGYENAFILTLPSQPSLIIFHMGEQAMQ